ncbi:phage integrase central domain-containing protein [Nitrobacter sp. TKz-YC01]|uniref:phage integrase central domain-containing protein n=1 Tax=Nitrobacter sp. TKz-YC01 TaxID=3398703 RepID=UPI003A102D7E
MSFDECAMAYISAHRAGWRNIKHASQWINTLGTYCSPVFGASDSACRCRTGDEGCGV